MGGCILFLFCYTFNHLWPLHLHAAEISNKIKYTLAGPIYTWLDLICVKTHFFSLIIKFYKIGQETNNYILCRAIIDN